MSILMPLTTRFDAVITRLLLPERHAAARLAAMSPDDMPYAMPPLLAIWPFFDPLSLRRRRRLISPHCHRQRRATALFIIAAEAA